MVATAVRRRISLCLLLATAIAAALPAFAPRAGARGWDNSAGDDRLYAVSSANELLVVDRSQPHIVHARMRISGLTRGEWLVGIDVRPATGDLYGIGSTSRVYAIDVDSGKATMVGGPFSPRLDGTSFGIDFNPVVDRIRLVSNTGQNLRLHPDTGMVVAVDGRLAFAPGDPAFGAAPAVVGAAYTNNVAGATTTTLYNLEARRNLLVTQSPPNAGVLNSVVPLQAVGRNLLGFAATSQAGFDIASVDGADMAWVAIRNAGQRATMLYTLDLATGRLFPSGSIGRGDHIIDIAVPID